MPVTRRSEKLNRPPKDEPWVWMTHDMLMSDAWAALTLPARRVVERIVIEHMNHGGRCNGDLAVTYDDFQAFGVRRNSIRGAIKLSERMGWIMVTQKGGRSSGRLRWPSRYGLTWLPIGEAPPVNTWKRVSARLPPQDIKRSSESATRETAKSSAAEGVVVAFPLLESDKNATRGIGS